MGRRRQIVYVLLFLYIGVSLTYQVAASVFLITRTGDFNPRNQVQAPVQFGVEPGKVSAQALLPKALDRLESINGIRYTGYGPVAASLLASACWRFSASRNAPFRWVSLHNFCSLERYPKEVSIGEQIFLYCYRL